VTAVRVELTREELLELIREGVRAELSAERPKPVDAPKSTAVRRKPSAEMYEHVRRLRRRKGLDE